LCFWLRIFEKMDGKMKIVVRLHGVFRKGRFKENTRNYPEKATVREVVEELNLPRDVLGIVLINERHGDFDDSLSEGDVLTILPILGGG
jgi:molybdopterin converting factor small subunit